jgi:hypothetical protein
MAVQVVIDGVGGKCCAAFERSGKQRTWAAADASTATGTRGTQSLQPLNRAESIIRSHRCFSARLSRMARPGIRRRAGNSFLHRYQKGRCTEHHHDVQCIPRPFRLEPFFRAANLPHHNWKIWFQIPGNLDIDHLTTVGTSPRCVQFLAFSTLPPWTSLIDANDFRLWYSHLNIGDDVRAL